jgi:hypothetical protein
MHETINLIKSALELAIDENNYTEAIKLLKEDTDPIDSLSDIPLFIRAVESKNIDLVDTFINVLFLRINTPGIQDHINTYFVKLINSSHEHFLTVAQKLRKRYKIEKLLISKVVLEAARANKRLFLAELLENEFYVDTNCKDNDWQNYYFSSLIIKGKINEATSFIDQSMEGEPNPVSVFIAFLKGHYDLVITLLEKGGSPQSTYIDNISVFEKAVELGHDKLIDTFIFALDKGYLNKEDNDQNRGSTNYFFQFIKKLNELKILNLEKDNFFRQKLLGTLLAILKSGARPGYVYYFNEAIMTGEESLVAEFIIALKNFRNNETYPLELRIQKLNSCFILFISDTENRLLKDVSIHPLYIMAMNGLLQIGANRDYLYHKDLLFMVKLGNKELIDEYMKACNKKSPSNNALKKTYLNFTLSPMIEAYKKMDYYDSANPLMLTTILSLLAQGATINYDEKLTHLINELISDIEKQKYQSIHFPELIKKHKILKPDSDEKFIASKVIEYFFDSRPSEPESRSIILKKPICTVYQRKTTAIQEGIRVNNAASTLEYSNKKSN